ncbi:MAG: biotin--[acetyl-CoA-carboxylase] ligase [Acidobacteriota bacterium]|nr:biotin--[acetyl-CoA-carboxylase] ligase [Acidobacteriota bacterium]
MRWVTRVDSTNTALKALARGGAPDGLCLCADEQTAGRGQYGRSWHSPAGQGLYLSILRRTAPATADVACVTTFAGLMVHRALTEFVGDSTRLSLKRPNDVFLDGGKVAGVLVEAEWQRGALEFLIIGIGVNVGQVSFPDGLRHPATSLRLALGDAAPTREAVLHSLLDNIQTHWEAFIAAPVEFVADHSRNVVFH